MTPKQEIRKSYIFNRYTIIAPGRDLRPRDIEEFASEKKGGYCPFCRKNLPDNLFLDRVKAGKDEVVAIKNIFPALSYNAPLAYGDQEVIVETKLHNKKMADFSEELIKATLEINIRRATELLKNPKINYALCFKNQGPSSGASLKHPHSQNFASAFVPPLVKEELAVLKKYRSTLKSCAYEDILKAELKSPRKIYSDKYVGVFAPYASEYHFEAWILTKRHVSNPADLTELELLSLAKALKILVKKMAKLNISFNYFFQVVKKNNDQHFYIKFQPRDAIWAGVELGAGLPVNSVAPETAAKYYRQ